MAKFSAKPILSDASELDDLIFKNGQTSLAGDLNDFVDNFETSGELLPLDSLASTYVQLTSCDQKLKKAVGSETVDATLKQSSTTLSQLNLIVEKLEAERSKKEPSPVEIEREEYKKLLAERKKSMEKEIQRQSDKLDEYYAKQTRESIYRNLVGGNAWKLG